MLEADIQACFDEIGHTPLLARMRHRIKDKQILGLVKAFLKSGVMTTSGNREETLTGTPQGGILSPLLANIALSALDDHFDRQRREQMGTDQQRAQRKRNGLGNWKIVRYADDFVVMVSGQARHAEVLREEVAGVLAPMGLRLSPEKTRVVHIDEGFDFLGFHIRRRRKRGTQKQCVYTTPSKKAVQAAKDKVRQKTRRSTLHLSLAGLITSLNQTLRGWATYFPARRVLAGIPPSRQPRLVADRQVDTREVPRQEPCRLEGTAPPFLRPGMAARPRGGRVHRRIQRRCDPLPLPRQHHRVPMDPDTGSRRLTNGQDTWRARCVERRTPGSAGGPQKPTRGNPGRALRSDPTACLCPGRGPSGLAPLGDGRLTGRGGTRWRSCSIGSPVWMSARRR